MRRFSQSLRVCVVVSMGITQLFITNAKAGDLYITFGENTPSVSKATVSIRHTAREGVSESKDIYDALLPRLNDPALVMYSFVSFSPYALMRDTRPADSMSTIHIPISGAGLSSPVNNGLQFEIYDTLLQDGTPENNFTNKNIFADLYDSQNNFIASYDVKNLASTGNTIPLTINEGLSYTLNVRFEPNTFGFNELAAFANNWLQLCNTDNNKCDGLGEEGQYLTLIDFAYWADKWLLEGN